MPLGGYAHGTYIGMKKRYHHGKMSAAKKKSFVAAGKVQMKGGKFVHPEAGKGKKRVVAKQKKGGKKFAKIGAKFAKKRA